MKQIERPRYHVIRHNVEKGSVLPTNTIYDDIYSAVKGARKSVGAYLRVLNRKPLPLKEYSKFSFWELPLYYPVFADDRIGIFNRDSGKEIYVIWVSEYPYIVKPIGGDIYYQE